MAHNINRMVYAGEVPWHGLGSKLPANATYEEVAQLAGFYHVEERPLFMPGLATPVPDRKALVRADTGDYLATVGDGYEVMQFADLARAGVAAAGEFQAIWHTAGTLGAKGIKGWMLAELPGVLRVQHDESVIRKYVVLSTGHDGYTTTHLKNTGIRVVCQNTLTAAARGAGMGWRMAHKPGSKVKLEAAVDAFKHALRGYEQFGELANAMVQVRLNTEQVVQVLNHALPLDTAEDAPPQEAQRAARARVLELHETAIGLNDHLRGTAWGAYQAWTEYADHNRGVKQLADGSTAARRLDSIWFGAAAQLKQRAMDGILAAVKLAA